MKTHDLTYIATIGPTSGSPSKIKSLKASGMTAGRLNMSHGTHQSHREYMQALKAHNIPRIMDLSGPRTTSPKGHSFDPNLSALTEKDHYDLAFAKEMEAEWVALSYVKDHQDVDLLRFAMKNLNLEAKVISKIEHGTALENLSEILAASDAVLIGRGDLADAIGLENTTKATLESILTARLSGVPIVIGTEILYSMTENPKPTRAEATDAWLHGYAGASGVMLSNETAVGKHPEKALEWVRMLFSAGQKDRRNGKNLL